jgi:isocitrate lyase
VPTAEAIQKLVAARLAADCLGEPTLIMARTDAQSVSAHQRYWPAGSRDGTDAVRM